MSDEASQLAQLAQCLSASLSPDAATRQNAEQFLASGAQQGGFSILLLKLVASDAADAPARVAGAVAFKNLVKKHWNPAEEPDVVGAPARRKESGRASAPPRGRRPLRRRRPP